MKSKLIKFAPFALLMIPMLVVAADLSNITDIGSALKTLVVIYLLPLVMSLLVVMFFWGMIRYVTAAGDEEKRKAGRGYMLWSVIALAVAFSIWGLVAWLRELFGVGGNVIDFPRNPIPGR